jgi:segregation and condensation protein B
VSDPLPESEEAPEPAIDGERLAAALEALLFSHGAPVSGERLAEVLDADLKAVLAALDALDARYAALESGLRLARIAGGFQLTTRVEWKGAIERLMAPKREQGLTEAALEALSVIAYRQPVTMPELNEIRGVNSQSVVATLMKHRLIRSRGRKQVVGRPLLYGTTKDFLERFELDRLEDLPKLKEFEDAQASGAEKPPGGGSGVPAATEPEGGPEPGGGAA